MRAITIAMGAALMSVVACSSGPNKMLECSDDSECGTGYACSVKGACVAENPGKTDGGPADAKPASDAGPSCSTAGWKLALSTCAPCLQQSCCADVGACNSNASCTSYTSCIAACSTDACYTACATTYAEGSTIFNKIGACASTSCNDACIPKKGIGDACKSSSDCMQGTTCTEQSSGTTGWCTKACSGNSQTSCPGSHGGYNEKGEYNWCVNTSKGYQCFPGCDGSNGSCNGFGSSYCQGAYTYNSTSVRVCAY